jgi:hypothetical protein
MVSFWWGSGLCEHLVGGSLPQCMLVLIRLDFNFYRFGLEFQRTYKLYMRCKGLELLYVMV